MMAELGLNKNEALAMLQVRRKSMMAKLGLIKNGAPGLGCNTGSQVRTAELGLNKNGAPET